MTGGSYDEMKQKGMLGGGCASTTTSTSTSTSTAATSSASPRGGTSSSLARRCASRLYTLYHNLTPAEISGSCGDLGTFIPLAVAMARGRSIALAPALFFAGISNIVGGVHWDVPMPVQPMKSIAAVAISESWSLTETTTAGILTGGLIFIIGTTYLIELINVIVPLPVVTGIQVGVGLRLMGRGMTDISALPWVGYGDSILLAIVVSILAMYWLREPRPRRRRLDGDANDNGERDGSSSTVSTAGGAGGEEEESAMPPIEEEDGGRCSVAGGGGRGGGAGGDGDGDVRRVTRPATPGGGGSPAGGGGIRRGWWIGFRRYACCCIPSLSLSPSQKKDGDLPPHPVGVYLFLAGCIFAAVELATTDNADGRYDLPLRFFGAPVAIWALDGATAADWRVGFLEGAVPQIPLTTLNSVISVCALAAALYPEKRKKKRKGPRRGKEGGEGGSTRCRGRRRRRRRGGGGGGGGSAEDADDGAADDDEDGGEGEGEVVSRREVSVSVGLMNMILCPFGGMPNCHGAGGLAGQHRFGARTGSSVCFLGANKVILAVFFGASALTLMDAFPAAILGVMLAIAGGELCTTGLTLLVDRSDGQARDAAEGATDDGEERRKIGKRVLRQNTLIAIVTTSVIVALRRTDYGVLAGWVTHMIYGDGTRQLLSWIRGTGCCLDRRRRPARRRRLSTSASSRERVVAEGDQCRDGGPINADEAGGGVLDNGELHVKCTSSIIGSLRRNDDFKGVA